MWEADSRWLVRSHLFIHPSIQIQPPIQQTIQLAIQPAFNSFSSRKPTIHSSIHSPPLKPSIHPLTHPPQSKSSVPPLFQPSVNSSIHAILAQAILHAKYCVRYQKNKIWGKKSLPLRRSQPTGENRRQWSTVLGQKRVQVVLGGWGGSEQSACGDRGDLRKLSLKLLSPSLQVLATDPSILLGSLAVLSVAAILGILIILALAEDRLGSNQRGLS